MKTNVQIIGTYLNGLVKFLEQNNICCEGVIDECSPFAMAGKSDQSYFGFSDGIEASMLTVLNIKKNLAQMLSHNESNFCSNYNLQPIGKEVRKKNNSEYIIIMNSFAVCPLYEKNGTVYSELWHNSEFIKSIREDKSFKKRTFPFEEDFNWKYYYDHFINAVKGEYDRNHIIFIKCNCARWYMDEQDINAFDANRSMRFKNMIEQIDDYFIENTHCIVIDEHFNHIPPKAEPNRQFPYVLMSSGAANKIGEEIVDIINGNNVSKNYFSFIPKSSCMLAERLRKRLSSKTLERNKALIYKIEREWISFNDLRKSDYSKNDFYANLLKLEFFIGGETERTLSDYALRVIPLIKKGECKADVELIEAYTKYFRLDLNDIIAVYKLFGYSSDIKNKFGNIAENFIGNGDFLPLNSSKKLFNKNLSFLKNYPYLTIDLPEQAYRNKAYIKLENNSILIIDPNSADVFIKSDELIKDDFDYEQIINNGYYCPIEYADALTYSYEFYSEKARRGDGAKPAYLKFESVDVFLDTLNYVDYAALLSNENFVFSFPETDAAIPSNFTPNVDLTVFMDPDTVIVRVQNGLADQICHYMLGQAISVLTNRKVVYSDLPCTEYNGCELKRFAKNKTDFFSDYISQRLSLIKDDITMKNIRRINDYTLVTDNGYFESVFKKIWWEVSGYFCKDLNKFLNTRIAYSYYYRLEGLNNLAGVFPFKLSDYIEFPPFEKEEHKKMSSELLSSDSVVIHIRRGDLVSVGWDTDGRFFIEAIQRVMSFPQYKNKKFFVFSDDIPWCKSHKSEIGLDLVGDSSVYFVEGNSYDESFRDLQLMALGKIMIIADSNFSRTAAILNDNCEIMYCGNKKFFDTYRQNVRENKYGENVYPFSKDYARPYIYMQPKKNLNK